MSVSYTRKQREYAKANKKHLISIDTPGLTYQGTTDTATMKRLVKWTLKNLIEKERA